MKQKTMPFYVMALLTALISACATLHPAKAPLKYGVDGVDGVACVGSVQSPPVGAVESSDPALLQKSLGASGEGKLCEGKVFMADKSITVYRVWNSEKRYTQYGSWWSFDLPRGPKLAYREENGICPSWSALDRMSSCTIKVGAKFVVGPGQSASCKQVTYEKSAVNQVYIPNDTRVGQVYVENCTDGVAWP